MRIYLWNSWKLKEIRFRYCNSIKERIYESVIPYLATGIIKARKLDKPKENDVKLIYEMALKILFRLLFIAYAEDRDLLPYKANEIYRTKSLKQKAIFLQEKKKMKIK